MARKMKDSGVEWIGEIPEGWEVRRVKHLFEERNEFYSYHDDLPLLSVSAYYGVAKRSDLIEAGETLIRSESLEGYKISYKDDIVINIMLAWAKGLGWNRISGLVSPAYDVYAPKNDVCSRYYHYLFRTDKYASVFKQWSTGIIDSRLRLYSDKFFSIAAQYPPLGQQRAISAYLDRKTAQIDRSISLLKQSIAKLKEYRQAVITEAVTKGLDPNAKMKDSGVEWIGEIPEGWEVRRLRSILKLTSGEMLDSTFIAEMGKYPVYGGNGIRGYTDKYLIDMDTILIGRVGAQCGNIHISQGKAWVTEHSLIVSLVKQKIYKGWLSYVLLAMNLNQYSASAAQPVLAAEKLVSLLIPFVEENYQRAISAYLDRKTAQIDTIIAQKEKLLAKLAAYKQSLIYEYVTGKREVPDE